MCVQAPMVSLCMATTNVQTIAEYPRCGERAMDVPQGPVWNDDWGQKLGHGRGQAIRATILRRQAFANREFLHTLEKKRMTATSAAPAVSETALVSLRGVSKTYMDGNVQALRDVSLDVKAGEFLTIVGPSGCGKSTLLHMLGGLDRPSSGEIRFQGERLSADTNLDRWRARHVGFVFQSFYLLPNLTAAENVQLPMFEGELPRQARAGHAAELLELVGLGDRLHHLPNQLSIGQRQRVAIARALANEPLMVLADEPTGSLDSRNGRDVMELLKRLNQEHSTALVIVTHDERFAALGQRQVRMLDGAIIQPQDVSQIETK
jgi:ABC-type lipoprotein export system ATPase subunit